VTTQTQSALAVSATTIVPLVAVLAGGEGRRMGGGKPMRRFGSGTLVDRALQLAGGYGPTVVVVLREDGQLNTEIKAQRIYDVAAIPGPLGGLAAVLGWAREQGYSHVQTLPCDAPLLPPDLLSCLAAAVCSDRRAVVAASGGRMHPTCALWTVTAADMIEQQVSSQRFSLIALAECVGLSVVEWPSTTPDVFSNANTDAELEELQIFFLTQEKAELMPHPSVFELPQT
jgi:molybdenum cofactor guanylyltransferase